MASLLFASYPYIDSWICDRICCRFHDESGPVGTCITTVEIQCYSARGGQRQIIDTIPVDQGCHIHSGPVVRRKTPRRPNRGTRGRSIGKRDLSFFPALAVHALYLISCR